ncbi:acyl-CoA-binding domain-containing protein 1-like [Silene latifolia]|uniref:acyl-CoA-binding domain-containing protein 1-like n=1 Tax=Silene latifolia TaxID=37657 RepID=UPI003D789703
MSMAGGDWHQLLQSIIIGLIFSFLLAKLISLVTAFKDDNLSISRATSTSDDTHTRGTATVDADDDPLPRAAVSGTSGGGGGGSFGDISEVDDTNSVVAEKGSVFGGDFTIDDVTSDDDDWEGVETTELDDAFSAATAFVAASAAERGKVSNDVQLQLYGLYKIATEGPCSAPPPPAFKMTARAKWNAWQKLGAMPPEDAMQKYVDIVTDLFPSWANGGSDKTSGENEIHSSDSKGPMGPVFSSLIHEEESRDDLIMEAVHGFAREGDVDNLLKSIENGISVNVKDSEGRTPLHWAVDRGHLPVIEQLLKNNVDVNAKDNEGQTPLHYAVVCDREAVAEYLVKHNADVHAKDNDGTSPIDICEKNWPWMRPAQEVVE